MDNYLTLEQLQDDLEYVRENPGDYVFFDRIIEKYQNSTLEMKAVMKAFLYDKMLEDNPTYLIQKVAEENPNKIIYCNTQEDPFFRV
jgi:hypothetical protein